MQRALSSIKIATVDRIFWMAVMIVACFVSVLLLESQSAASYPTYALSLLMLATFQEWKDVLRLPLMRWVCALLIWLCVSVFWSEPFEWREAMSVWTRALLVFFFVVAVAECQLRGQLQRWMGLALTFVGAAAVLAAIVNFYVTNPADGRLNGLGQLDTHVIAALVYGVVLLFVLRMTHAYEEKWLRPIAIGVALLIAFAVLLSDSRNAWVSVLLGVGAYVLAYRSHDWRQFVVTVTAMGGIVLVALLLLAINDATHDLVLPRGNSFRFTIWGITVDRIMQDGAVVFGRGILTDDDVLAGGISFTHPHNIYLALVHQGGVVALGLYGAVLLTVFRSFAGRFETDDAKLGLSILTIAVFAHLLDGHELVDKVGDTWFLVWMPVGLAVGVGLRPT